MKFKRKVEKFYEEFRTYQKDFGTILEGLKQRVLVKIAKIEHYNEKIKQLKQNELFTFDQEKLFTLNGQTEESSETAPDGDQSRVLEWHME